MKGREPLISERGKLLLSDSLSLISVRSQSDWWAWSSEAGSRNGVQGVAHHARSVSPQHRRPGRLLRGRPATLPGLGAVRTWRPPQLPGQCQVSWGLFLDSGKWVGVCWELFLDSVKWLGDCSWTVSSELGSVGDCSWTMSSELGSVVDCSWTVKWVRVSTMSSELGSSELGSLQCQVS